MWFFSEGFWDFDPTGMVVFETIRREILKPRRVEYGIVASACGEEYRFATLAVAFGRLKFPFELYDETHAALRAGRLVRIGRHYLEGIEKPAARPYPNWNLGRHSYHGPPGFPPRATFSESEARESVEQYLSRLVAV